MLLLDLAKIRTSQYRFEQVYAPGDVPADGEAFTVVEPVTLAFDVFTQRGSSNAAKSSSRVILDRVAVSSDW